MSHVLLESIFEDSIYKIKEPLHIILNKPWIAISEDERVLLSKIVSSVKQSLQSVTIIHSEVFYTDELVNSKVILFGSKASPAITPYTLVKSGSNQLIEVDALSELDDAKKKTLWIALKQFTF
jgi:hypothetical protein